MKKKYLIILLVALVGLKTHAQTNASMPTDTSMYRSLNPYAQSVSLTSANTVPQQEYQHYLKTAKTLKVVGWTSLGVGIVSGYLGLAAHVTSTDTGEKADWLIVTGGALIATSIPLFIVSHHYKTKGNKLKAVSISLGSQQVFVPQGNGFTSSVQPALSVRVSL